MMFKRQLIVCGIALASVTGNALAAEHVVSQKDKKFSASNLRIRAGDTVTFRNNDPFFHNIFSLSPAQSFDVGTFAKGESRNVVFEKAGTVEIECAIHPEMKLTVEVVK